MMVVVPGTKSWQSVMGTRSLAGERNTLQRMTGQGSTVAQPRILDDGITA
jgi:hypothetical protein